jgi:hypothetical protein
MDERESRLPMWTKELLADLRKRVACGNEPLIKEITRLRPKVELLSARNGALMELLECAARGGSIASCDIINIIQGYSLELVKEVVEVETRPADRTPEGGPDADFGV